MAQANRTATTSTAATTIAMSALATVWGRKGLRPMTVSIAGCPPGTALLSAPMRRRPRLALIALAAALAVPLAACGGDSEPGGEASTGESVYSDNCARCHGPDGEGGTGPALGDGAVAENLPDIEDQLRVIREGRNGMPAWDEELTPEEIDAVATYEREELGQ